MKVTKQETLYHANHGATLKHKCGKKDSSIAPFNIYIYIYLGLPFFSLAFLFFFWAFIFFGLSLFLGNALVMMINTLLLTTTHELQLKTRTRYDSI